MTTAIQDLRYAIRTLLKRPGFTLAVVFTSGIRDALDQGSTEFFLFLSFWLTIWSLGVAVLVVMVTKAWAEAFLGGVKITKIIRAFFLTLFALPFFAGEVVGLFLLEEYFPTGE